MLLGKAYSSFSSLELSTGVTINSLPSTPGVCRGCALFRHEEELSGNKYLIIVCCSDLMVMSTQTCHSML